MRGLPRVQLPSRSGATDADRVGMTHEQLLDALRAVEGLVDVGHDPPNFHVRSRPFLQSLRASAARFILLVLLLFGCGGRSEWGPDREELFVSATSGSTQHEHPCQNVQDTEFSLRTGFLTKSMADALHERIAQADADDVHRCLADVQTYNRCFLALPCEVLADATTPAWLLGDQSAPCACGVVHESLGPFAGPVPSSLSNCIGILPVTVGPPRPGIGCPE